MYVHRQESRQSRHAPAGSFWPTLPCPARLKVLSVGILGDPATSPGSCCRKRGLVTHQALLPAAGEPALPLFRPEQQGIVSTLGSSAAPHVSFLFPKLHSRTSRLRTWRPASPGVRAVETLGPRPCRVRSGSKREDPCQGTEQTGTPLQGSRPGSRCRERGLLLRGEPVSA